jgi:hypothetical protein
LQFFDQGSADLVQNVEEGQLRAFLSQTSYAGLSDAERGAGDDADSVFDPIH